jgi:hypothetical protein
MDARFKHMGTDMEHGYKQMGQDEAREAEALAWAETTMKDETMIATDFKLIPLAVLHKHEAAVLRGLDALPISYQKSLLDEPEIRYAFLYYALLTHWPELLNGDFTADELLYNRLYWFVRLSREYQVDHDFDAGFAYQGAELFETANRELGANVVRELEWAAKKKEITVSFSSFSIGKVKDELGVQIDETGDFFADVAPVPISSLLVATLKESMPLALKINTEKARSEMIVAPLLIEIYGQLDKKISLFSGVDWEVDGALGLRGRCDFLMGLSREQLRIEAPVLAIVEVKNDDTSAGIAQCLAEMVAARIFNQQNKNAIATIYGAVTTGSIWKFMRLIDSTAYVDTSEYHIKEVERIVGIIVSVFTSSGVAKKT